MFRLKNICLFASTTIAVAIFACALTGCGDSSSGTNGGGTPSSGTISIQGAGATFPAPLYAKWIVAFNTANPNVKADYQSIGSGGGIKGITDRTVQFGASDGPMTDEQLKAAPAKILHLPTVSGPEVMIYNLPSVKEVLKLNGEVIAEMYLGTIKKWNDPKIAALNAGVALPDKDVVVAHRSDGSGTTWIFTNYLSKVSPEWKTKVGNATSVQWPVGVGGKGNEGVAAAAKGVEGGIGYVEMAYVEKSGLPYATQINKAGKPVRASVDGVVAAAKNSTEVPEDMRVSITDAPGDESYSICGYTYLLVYEDMSYLKNQAQAEAVMKFIHWGLTDGQAMAKPSYAPLSDELQKKVLEKLKTIMYDGKPLMK
ncbi:MAG TPA: phosphate ABC transporter substrate-binding protein PstS [Planctomycetota bacterium]|nr:phosphate ABC transporter substrate-binding protein PstS [Planctomycetota bacterium]